MGHIPDGSIRSHIPKAADDRGLDPLRAMARFGMGQVANTDCVFCKIVAGDLPCHEVYSDEHVLAFLDIGPVATGHLLLIPKIHCDTILELPADEAALIGKVIPRMARSVMEVTGAEGINILQNNGACAGQVVGHVHFHFIPRTEDDGLGYRWNAGTYEPGQAEDLRDRFCEHFKRG